MNPSAFAMFAVPTIGGMLFFAFRIDRPDTARIGRHRLLRSRVTTLAVPADTRPLTASADTCPPHNWTISGHIATCTKCGASQNVS